MSASSSPKRQRTESEETETKPQTFNILLIEVNEDCSTERYLVTFQDEAQLNCFSTIYHQLIEQQDPTIFIAEFLNYDDEEHHKYNEWNPEAPPKDKDKEYNQYAFTRFDFIKFCCGVIGFEAFQSQFIHKKVAKFQNLGFKHLEELDGTIYGTRVIHSWC